MLQHDFAPMHIRRMDTFLGTEWPQAGTDLPRCGDQIPFTACASSQKGLPPQPPQASESIDPEFSGLVFCRVYLLSQLDSLLLTDVRAGLLACHTGLGSCGLYNVVLGNERPISIGSATHYAHFTGLRPVSFTAARTFQDLRSFIFSDHPLELHKKLIFRAVALWRLHEHCLDSVAGELLDQQDLVRVLAAQAVRGIREHYLDVPFSGEVSHALQAWPLQRGSTVAFIFEHPLFGYLQIVAL